MPQRSVETPTGRFELVEEGGALVRAEWGGSGDDATALLLEAERQVLAYYARELEVFDLPLEVQGSQFQRDVCKVMSEIPFGETLTYGQISDKLSVPAQAVGQACGGNPLPLIIPCHRVLGASSLGGFSGRGGVETKVWLLKHEGAGGLLI